MTFPLPSALSLWMVLAAVALPGCAAMRPDTVPSNPLFVRTAQHELVWERSVDVLHQNLFEIENENRLDGMIETKYKTAAGLLEPWHPDSPGLDNRLEATLQSLRRKAFIAITPAEGGYLVSVEAYKELEDVAGAANSAGAATFLDNNARKRDLETLMGQATPSGWIPKGRDVELERLLLEDLYAAFNK